MIDHNLTQFSLDESYDGEMIIPSEQGNINVPATLRQFIIQARRNYSENALTLLADTEDIKLTLNTPFSTLAPYFYLKLIVKPSVALQQFAESEEGESFFNKVLELAGHSDVRFKSGKRSAFIGAFSPITDNTLGVVLVSNILISTTVFYNDYRATCHFPESEEDHTEVVSRFFNVLHAAFPHIDLEISYETIEANPASPFDSPHDSY